MPIYAYRCSNCGHAQDVLQRMSDPLLTVCPACGEPSYVKKVTAAGFQLKGSGWYVTDFRGDKTAAKPADDAPKNGDKADGDAAAKTPAPAGEAASKAEAAPAAALAPVAAPAAAAPPAPGKTGP